MPARNIRSAGLWLVPAIATSCLGDKQEDTGVHCDAPVALIGQDQTVTLGAQVTLDGSLSSFCEKYAEQVAFNWSIQAPAASTIDESALSDNKSATAVQPTFSPDVVGDYVISLVLADPQAESNADYMVVTVTSADAPPTADCGGPYEGKIDESLQLDGSGSADPEGARLSYEWSLTGAPSCSNLDSSQIFNSGGPTPTVVPDCEGVFTVSLVVSDGVQYSDVATCYIDVEGDDRPPVADAGETTDLGACADNPFQLDGWGSYDPDGDDLTWLWSVVSVPSGSAADDGSFNDPTSPEPLFTWDVVGSYLFQLEVSDGTNWSAPDIVTYTIDDTDENHGPVANAGEDQTLESTADCESSSYVWTCDDCEPEDVELDGSSSYDSDGDSVSYYWSESTGVLTISNPYGAITDATIAAQPAEYGVDSTTVYVVDLDVADCVESDTDSISITFTCTGE